LKSTLGREGKNNCIHQADVGW